MVVCHGDGFLHYLGNKRDFANKKFIQFEISDLNEQNKYGECLLFVAAYFSEYDIVSNLLQLGADPNTQNNYGNTPLHAAAYFGNIKMMQLLVNGGADLRIVNKDGLKPSQVVKNPKYQVKVKSFETGLFSNLQNHLKLSYEPISLPHKKMNIVENFVKHKTPITKTVNPQYIYPSGFGNYTWKNQNINGLVTYVETIHNSTDLGKEQILPNFMYGSFAFYNGFWNHEKISIKMIKPLNGKENCFEKKEEIMANFLFKEVHVISSLRHPDILLLMCVNLIVKNSLPMVYYQLVFEKINIGSLHSILYEQNDDLVIDVKHMFSQIVNAVIFLHSHSLVHCSISSYAIYLLNDTTAKLGNFEYAFELKVPSYKNKNHYLSSINVNDDIYKWMAPELFNKGQTISTSTDIYGIALTIYETFIKQIPNRNRSFNDTVKDFSHAYDEQLLSNVPFEIRTIFGKALDFEPGDRTKIRDILNYLHKETGKSEAVYASLNKSTKLPYNHQLKIDVENTKNKVLPLASVTNLSRKSNSLTCLSPSTSSLGYSSSLPRYANSKLQSTVNTACSSIYRELAALPPSYPDWAYPHPQTEKFVEGHGTLSSRQVNCFKPASHQVSLSSSHTSISELPGQLIDLIKISSNIQKTASNISVFSDTCSYEDSAPSTITSKKTTSTLNNNPLFTHGYKKLNSATTSPKTDSVKNPTIKSSNSISPRIANLVNHYEKHHDHPYSAKKSPRSSPITPQKNQKQIKKPPFSPSAINKSPLSTPSNKDKTKRQNEDVENQTPVSKNLLSHNLKPTKKNFASKIFGDITNKYH